MTNIYLVALSGTQLTETPTFIDDVTGLITVPTLLPVNQNHLATKEYTDQAVAAFITQDDLEDALADLAPQSEIIRLQGLIDLKADADDLTDLSASVLHLIGGTMTGPILWPTPPVNDNELVNKAYVDSIIGDALSGAITITAADGRYVNTTGDVMTGHIVLDEDPVAELHAATKQYVDARTLSSDDYVRRAGDTMGGPLILSRDPEEPMEAATKQYVDNVMDLRLNPELAAFYSSGAIVMHLSRYSVEWDAAEPTKMRGWRNRAGDASMDALIPAGTAPLNFANNMAQFVNGSQRPALVTPKNIAGMRMLWAMVSPPPRANQTHIIGGRDLGQTVDSNISGIRLQGTSTARVMVVDSQSGSQVATVIMGAYRGDEIYAVPQIWEFMPDYAGGRYYLALNGADWASSALIAGDTAFMLGFIGSTTPVNLSWVGQMGEVMLVDMNHPDGAAALAYARSYLCNLFGITEGVIPPAPADTIVDMEP